MTKTNTRSRIVSILLVLMMLLTMVPITGVTASAAEPEWTTVNTYEEWKAAMQQPGDKYIRLGADIDTSTMNSGFGLGPADFVSAIGRSHLDLNGKKLTLKKSIIDSGGKIQFIRVTAGELIIEDSQSGGEIFGVNNVTRRYMRLIDVGADAKLTLNSGKLHLEFNADADANNATIESMGTVEINGGTVATSCPGGWDERVPYVYNQDCALHSSGEAVIKDGTFDGRVVLKAVAKASGVADNVISGGDFKKSIYIQKDKAVTEDVPLNVSIQGGTYHYTPGYRMVDGVKESDPLSNFQFATCGFSKRNNDYTYYPLADGTWQDFTAEYDMNAFASIFPKNAIISATGQEYELIDSRFPAIPVKCEDAVYTGSSSALELARLVNSHYKTVTVTTLPDPTLTGNVYYTSSIVYDRPISTGTSGTPDDAVKAYQWQRRTDGGEWTDIEGATRGSYTPVAADMGENVRIRVKVTAEGYLGEIIGAALKVSKAANNNYPEVIKLEAVKNGAGNYTGFKITNFDSDYEYVYSTTDTPNWSANQISSATVTGLTSNTTYYVFARFKETATHTAGSIVSKNSIMLFDNVPLHYVLLEGYNSGETIYIKKGESVTLKVSADPINANSWNEITFKDDNGGAASNIAISNAKIDASGTTPTAFPNGHSITIKGVSKGSATLKASYPGTNNYYGSWYVVVYDDSTVANALRLESVYAYADITLSVNDDADLPIELPKLLPENSGYHLEWRILKRGTYGATYVTENDNIKLEDGKIKPKAAHAASEKAQLELVAVKDGSTEYKTLPKTSLFYVTVTEAPVIELTGITVAPTKVNLELNATYQLSAVKEPVNAAGSLNWESSNTSVATVDSTGKVTAKAQGTAIITVSCGDKKATCTVTVDHQHDYSGQSYLYLDPGNHYQECKLGDGYNIQTHEFTPWTDNGNGTHSRHCTVCKMSDGSTYTETAEHTWVWVVDQEAALNQPGKQHEECVDCPAKRSENTEIPALRDYAVTVTGGTATVAAGTPITRAMAGVEVTVTAQVPDGKHFVKWVVNGVTLANETSATTTFIMPANDVTIEAEIAENPVESYTLTVIKGTASVAAGTPITDKVEQNTVVTVKADAPETGKVFDKWVVLEGGVTLTDATKATTTFTMPGNAVKIEATYKDAPPAHTHSYGTEWKYDGTNHWHECQCGDKADTAAHSFQWVIDKAATKEATGIKHEECTVCGAKRSENTVIPKDSGSPETGDSSNLIGWLAALFVSGGVLTVLGVSSKKRKESEAE